MQEDGKFCEKCGAALAQPRSMRGTSRLAVASMVLGILGFPFGPCSVPAIICGALAIGRIETNPSLRGKGMAIAGLVCGSVALIIWIAAVLMIGWLVWVVTRSG
jgi:hypothetical protein